MRQTSAALPLLVWVERAMLVGLLAFGAFSGLERFEGKAFGWRLVTYPLVTLVVPVAWRLAGRRLPYPWSIDALVVAPFLVDVVGNALDLYDTVSWWDDLNHLVNWFLLALAVGLLVRRIGLRPWLGAALVVGFGATTAILWELGEYVAFIRNSSELASAYTDTLGDEVLGLTGAAAAALLSALLPRRASPPA